MDNIFSHKSLIAISMVILLASSCGVANKNLKTSSVYYTKEGLFSSGTNTSVSKSVARTMAIFDAQNELWKTLNAALSEIDKRHGNPEGTHSFSQICATAVSVCDFRKLNTRIIQCDVTLMASKDILEDWLNSYFEELPPDDSLVSAMSKKRFVKSILKYLTTL